MMMVLRTVIEKGGGEGSKVRGEKCNKKNVNLEEKKGINSYSSNFRMEA